MKTLSFIIPAYNSAAFLDDCISSMLSPAVLEELEILVVNDGSTDGTAEIAQGYCARYPGVVRLISQENRGHGGALNTGLEAAQGKYLKVVDADDRVLTENLPAFVALLRECGSDVVLTHHRTADVSTGEVKNWRSYPPEFGRAYSLGEILADWKCFDRSMTFHGITYNRAFYRKYGIPLSEHVFYEDHEYATFPCCHAESVTPFDLSVYLYRVGDSGQSVALANQLRRLDQVTAVLGRMRDSWGTLRPGAGRDYAAMKIQGLLLSYLTTTLLAHPDRRLGRQLAAAEMKKCRADAPPVYALARGKYRVFLLLNRLHVSKAGWDRLLNSGVYNRIMGKQDFN